MSQVVDGYIEVGGKKCVMEARSGQYEPGIGRKDGALMSQGNNRATIPEHEEGRATKSPTEVH
jgi:hypothetical protein